MKKLEETKITSATVQPIKPRRKFDSAFKRDAVALWLGSGKSARKIHAAILVCACSFELSFLCGCSGRTHAPTIMELCDERTRQTYLIYGGNNVSSVTNALSSYIRFIEDNRKTLAPHRDVGLILYTAHCLASREPWPDHWPRRRKPTRWHRSHPLKLGVNEKEFTQAVRNYVVSSVNPPSGSNWQNPIRLEPPDVSHRHGDARLAGDWEWGTKS